MNVRGDFDEVAHPSDSTKAPAAAVRNTLILILFPKLLVNLFNNPLLSGGPADRTHDIGSDRLQEPHIIPHPPVPRTAELCL